ncbi:hypothetical protein [Phreatobacter sp.]|uniref:hypothetical protein n=1 Tax=Phreatobacter sp. TaxID=1966341 RepID=UPI003F6F8BA6
MSHSRRFAVAGALALALAAGFSGLAEARSGGGGGGGGGGAGGALDNFVAAPTHPGRGRGGTSAGAREGVTECWFDARVRREVCERVSFYR